MKLGLFFRVTHQSKVHTIIYPILNASNLTNQYISYSMALFSANEIRTFFYYETENEEAIQAGAGSEWGIEIGCSFSVP